MKSLTFRKADGVFVAEFTATNNFNLHIEGVAEGNVRLYQRGVSGGDYSLVRGLPTYPSYGTIFDCDFTSPVWPKYLKVECATEPVSGYVTESTAVPGGGGGGSDVVILNQTKSVTITENGSVSVTADEGFTGLDRVDVNVSVEHEVNNQEKTVDIVANGTTDIVPDAGYDGLGKVSVKVNVPSSGGGASAVYESDVNFRDYDGTLLHSYTKDEFLALSAMPELPTREGLICQEWNWDFAEAQAYVANYGILEVGATYTTDDGRTRFYISLDTDERLEVQLYFSQTVANGVSIDWGDGSAEETVSGTGYVTATHTYPSKGEYVIALSVSNGCTITLGNTSYGFFKGLEIIKSSLRKVEFGQGTIKIGTYGLEAHCGLECLSISKSVVSFGTGAFEDNYRLSYVSIPRDTVGFSGDGIFRYCSSLLYASLPNTLTSIPAGTFQECKSLRRLTIPTNVSLGSSCCKDCEALRTATLPTTVTSVSYNAFDGCHSLKKLYVPAKASGAKYMYKYCTAATTVEMEEGFTSVAIDMFSGCRSLVKVIIPKSLREIAQAGFYGCSSLVLVDFSKSESVVTITGSSAFTSIAADCKIVVPDALYDEWIAATNWTTYASYIVKASEYYGGSTISFTIDGMEYQATEGMTWIEWCNSEYNTDGWYADEWCVSLDVVIGETSWDYSEWKTISENGNWGEDISGNETIESGKAYLTYTNSDGVGGGV